MLKNIPKIGGHLQLEIMWMNPYPEGLTCFQGLPEVPPVPLTDEGGFPSRVNLEADHG